MVEFRCPSCSTPLGEGLAKCPSCGLPLKPQATKTRNRSLFAAFLLLALFAVGSLQAGLIIADPDGAIQPGSSFAVGSFHVEGVVRDANGTAASNVTVTLGAGPSDPSPKNTTTNASGAYRLDGVPVGVYELNATRDNRTSTLRLMVRQNEDIDLQLPTEPGTVASDHSSLAFVRIWLQVCGGVIFALCLVTLLGTVACYRRRWWGLAMAGAIAGSLLWLPLSLLLGVIAVVLLTKGRSEFS